MNKTTRNNNFNFFFCPPHFLLENFTFWIGFPTFLKFEKKNPFKVRITRTKAESSFKILYSVFLPHICYGQFFLSTFYCFSDLFDLLNLDLFDCFLQNVPASKWKLVWLFEICEKKISVVNWWYNTAAIERNTIWIWFDFPNYRPIFRPVFTLKSNYIYIFFLFLN